MFAPKAVVLFGFSVSVAMAATADTFPTGNIFDLTVGVNSVYQPAIDAITGGIVTNPVGFTSVSDMFDGAKLSSLMKVNSSYTDSSPSVIRMGYRGLPALISTGTTPTIKFEIPAINLVQVFDTKPTRDGNLDDLNEYLKTSGNSLLDQMQKLLVKVSPVDPVAGNPNSLQSQMMMADFDRGFTQFASNIKEATGESNNLIGIGLSIGSFTQHGVTNNAMTIPLSYVFRSDIDPARQLTLYAPVTVSSVEGAKSYAVNLGASYRYPITDDWALTPGIGYGITGSSDLGAGVAMLALSVTSQYVIHRDGYDIGIGNALGTYRSQKFSAGDYSSDPGISNTVFRNGVLLSFPAMVYGKKMAYEFSFINTRFYGSDLYSESYNEIGVTLGTNRSANSSRSYLRAGFTYLKGQNDIRGYRLNVGYWF